MAPAIAIETSFEGRSMRFIPTVIHGLADYAVGIGMILLAFAAGAEGAGFAAFVGLGGFAVAYALLTDYELGWKPYLTMPTHLAIDAGFALAMLLLPVLVTLPALLGWISVAIGLVAAFLVMTTRMGVGRAVALEFAKRGWRVALLARGRKRLDAVAAEARALGGEALAIPTDVADAGAVQRAADEIIGAWGRIDIWINNAMVTVFGPADRVQPDEFKRVTEVTYLGQAHGTLTALKHMKETGAGTIVCIGSALTYRSIPLQAAYCGAKSAIRGFVDSLRCELLHDRSPVRLTMIHLPAVNTPQFSWARCKMDREPRPVAPVFAPEAVAEEIYRGAIGAPRELWVGMPTVKTILGGLALPGLTDRMAASQAYEGQLDEKAAAPGRPDNLFAPVDLDQGVGEGRFGQEATGSVAAVSSAGARVALAGAGLALLAATRLLAHRPRIGRR
eukprot:g19996.t1